MDMHNIQAYTFVPTQSNPQQADLCMPMVG